MDKGELRHIIKDFNDVSGLLSKLRTLKSEIKGISRKLKSTFKKYEFIRYILELGANDDLLEENLKQLFKEIGFVKVNKVGKQLHKEDVRIILEDKIIIIEATGSKKLHATDDKTRQITKHLDIGRSEDENIFGVFIFNSDNQKNYKERNKVPFTDNQIKYAEAGKYGLLSTLDLIKGFTLVKTNRLTLTEFQEKLCSYGLIRFN